MPWDSAALYVARRARRRQPRRDPSASPAATAAPCSSPSGVPTATLYFIWDKTGWGQLYRWDGNRAVRMHGTRRRRAVAAAMGVRHAQLRAPPRRPVSRPSSRWRGTPLLEVARRSAAAAVTRRRMLQTRYRPHRRSSGACGDGFAALVSRAHGCRRRVMRIDQAPGSQPRCATASRRRSSRPASVGAQVREFRRPDAADRLRHLLRADEHPQYRGPQGALPAGPRPGARRPHSA